MSEHQGADSAGLALMVAGLACGVVAVITRPFLFAPIAFLLTLTGIALSKSRTRLGLAVTGLVVLLFVIGAAIAVWNSSALY